MLTLLHYSKEEEGEYKEYIVLVDSNSDPTEYQEGGYEVERHDLNGARSWPTTLPTDRPLYA